MKAKFVFCIWVLINVEFIFLWEASIFSVAFAKFRKANINFVKSVPLSAHLSFRLSICPSILMEQLGSHWMDFHEMLLFEDFFKYVEKN